MHRRRINAFCDELSRPCNSICGVVQSRVCHIILLIAQWSATQGAWYILTGLAGVARPATSAVVPTSPPLYFNTKLSVVRRDARLPKMIACRHGAIINYNYSSMLADVAVRAAAAVMMGCCWLRARSSPAYGPAPAFCDLPLIVKKKPRPSAKREIQGGDSLVGASNNNNNNNNTSTILWCCHGGQSRLVSPGLLDECRLSARRLPTLKPISQPTWAVSPVVGCCHPHHRRHLLLLHSFISPQNVIAKKQNRNRT